MNMIADETGAAPHVLLEVNVSGERSKSGMRPEDVGPAVRHIVEELAFHVVTRIPGGACLTMRNNRITDAVLYQRNL